ncbi:2466_t:CDS:2, partial [Funneliformis geosporum]
SERGKTSTIFAISAERWGIHIDCSLQAAFYENHLYRELSEIRVNKPSINNIPLQNKAFYKLDIALLSYEAQVLCRPEYGGYFGSTTSGILLNLLQAYTTHILTGFPVTHTISGTNMHMSSGVSLVTSVRKY